MVAAACLLPPTVLMGASLPAIARWVETTPNGVSRLGLLYSANIAGAVIGCLVAGFYLLRVYDMAVATYTAAAINAAVALLGAGLGGTRPRASRVGCRNPQPVQRAPGAALVYVAIALSGLTRAGRRSGVDAAALAAAGRYGLHLFDHSGGVSLGAVGRQQRRFVYGAPRPAGEPRLALAACQILLAVAIAATAYTLTYILPYWPVDPWLSTSPWYNFDLDVTRCLRAILPATLLWGASFPLALAGAAAEGEDPARLSGEVYAANTAGSLVGALAFSLVLIPAIGTRGSQQLLIWLAAAARPWRWRTRDIGACRPGMMRNGGCAFNAGRALAGAGLARVGPDVPPLATIPWQVIAYGRRVAPILRGLACRGCPGPHAVRWRGGQFIGGDHGTRRPTILLCQRQVGGFVRAARHAPAAHDGTSSRPWFIPRRARFSSSDSAPELLPDPSSSIRRSSTSSSVNWNP